MAYNPYRSGGPYNGVGQSPVVNVPGGLLPTQPADLQSNGAMILVQDEPRGASQLIEVPVTVAGTTKVVLPVIQNLQNQVNVNVVIKALRVIPNTVLALAPTLGGANAPLTELVKMSLVLYAEEWEKGQLIPLLTLVDTFTEGSAIPWRAKTTRLDNWRNVNWGKSYVLYSNGSSAAGTPYNIIFEAEYVKFDQDGNEITGAA